MSITRRKLLTSSLAAGAALASRKAVAQPAHQHATPAPTPPPPPAKAAAPGKLVVPNGSLLPWKQRDERLRLDELLAARRGSVALRQGSIALLFADHGTLVYRRESGEDVVDVALNFDPEEKTIALEDDERPRMTALAGRGVRLYRLVVTYAFLSL